MKQLKWSKKEERQLSNLLQALAWCRYITCERCVSSHIRTLMLEMGMASEIHIYLKEPKILLNSVSVKASRQTEKMFSLFWELCTVRSGMCLKQFTRIFHLCFCRLLQNTPHYNMVQKFHNRININNESPSWLKISYITISSCN